MTLPDALAAALLAGLFLLCVGVGGRLALRVLGNGLLGKELTQLFGSPVAWAAMAAHALIQGLAFVLLVEAYQGLPDEPLVRVFFGAKNPLFWIAELVIIPAVAMRLLAEERAHGTLELLLSAPVTDGEVVAAKFLAGCIFHAALWALTLLHLGAAVHYAAPDGIPGILAAAAPLAALTAVLDPGPLVAGYLGVTLLGGAWLAVSLLASALSRHQAVAFLIAFTALLALLALGLAEPLMQEDPLLAPLCGAVRFVSFPHVLDPFTRGMIDTRSVVYLVGLTSLALFLATRAVESAKWR